MKKENSQLTKIEVATLRSILVSKLGYYTLYEKPAPKNLIELHRKLSEILKQP